MKERSEEKREREKTLQTRKSVKEKLEVLQVPEQRFLATSGEAHSLPAAQSTHTAAHGHPHALAGGGALRMQFEESPCRRRLLAGATPHGEEPMLEQVF